MAARPADAAVIAGESSVKGGAALIDLRVGTR
jgi:hypothetical protein